MPETAVNKYRHARAAEDEVRSAKQTLMAPPPYNSVSAEQLDHPQLCRFISATSNARHNRTPFGSAIDV